MATKKPTAKKTAAKKIVAKKVAAKKPAAKKAAVKVSKDHWFSKLSKAAQAAYLKAHPNSKLGKGGAKKAAVKAPAAKKAATKAAPAGMTKRDVSTIKKYEKNHASYKDALKKETDPRKQQGLRTNMRVMKERIGMVKRAAKLRAK